MPNLTRLFFPLAVLTTQLSLPTLAQVLHAPGGTIGNIGGSNVGVGTASPAAKLDVLGDVRAGGSSWTGFYAAANGAIATLRVTDTGSYGSTVGFVGTDTPHPFVIRAAAQPVAWFAPNGNVGIGTFAPSHKFHIAGPDVLMDLQDTNSGGRTFSLGSRWGGIFTLTDETTAQVRLSIAPSGNVGIGTVTPYAPLDVAVGGGPNNVVVGQYLGRRTGGTSAVGMGVSSRFYLQDAGGALIESNGIASVWTDPSTAVRAARMDFYSSKNNSSSVAMSIAASGNVGVGTTEPAAALVVSNASYPQVRIDSSGPLSSGLDFYTQGTAQRARVGWIAAGGAQSGLWLWNYDNSNLVFGTTNTQRMTIDWQGNVGIGTTNPTNKLEVNGTIRTKEVVVETTGWSDYVFADGYQLAPLREVEAHIKAHKHLPGIPSAAEVADQGVSVGAMQAKLLAKLEELTLHVIAQEKRLNAQSAELQQLKAENAALKRN